DLNDELLFYSRPKGVYKGNDAKKLLLDFYLVNTDISPTGNKVKATINDVVFFIDEWTPYYIEGLPLGEISIKLELINNDGVLIETPFTPSERTVILE
ncbi:MAG: phosphopeptide-binding protein, partial [Flavobacteriaceae bacterium]|nr:phosphopeptide-binding protein [Flavobacteriaceae bacterium]